VSEREALTYELGSLYELVRDEVKEIAGKQHHP
jgi:hypothetical protein